MPKYYLTLQKDDGSTKKVPWDQERDPTPDEVESLLKLPDDNPNTIRHGLYENLVQPLIDTGTNATKHLKEGNYPAAFGDIAQPVMKPFTGAAEYLQKYLGGDKDIHTEAGKELGGYVGLNTDAISDAYSHGQYRRLAGLVAPTVLGTALSARTAVPEAISSVKSLTKGRIKALPVTNLEHGPYPLRDNPTPLGPAIAHEVTPFEGLTKSPEHQAFNWDEEHQQGLPLEYNDAEIQEPLRNEVASAGMAGKNNAAFEGLVPDRYKSADSIQYPQITGPKQPELFPNPSPEVPIVLAPKQFDFERPTWSRYAEQQNLPLDYDVLSEAENSESPELRQAVQQFVTETRNNTPDAPVTSKVGSDGKISFSRGEGYNDPNKVSNWNKLRDDNFKGDYTRLVQDSPAGRGIASMIDKYKTESAGTYGEISDAIKKVTNPLDKNQLEQLQHYLDTGEDIVKPATITVDNVNVGNKPKINPAMVGAPGITNAEMIANLKDPSLPSEANSSLPPEFSHMAQPNADSFTPSIDPMVKLAVDTIRGIDNKFVERTKNSGIHLKTATGEMVPFLGKENYWPRIYDASLFKDKPALVTRLIKQGIAPDVAANIVKNSRMFGERLLDPQNQRVMDLPDYRKDIGALLKHYSDMTNRVVGAETFGVKDIADPESAISNLVKETKDPEVMTRVLRQFLGREGGSIPYEHEAARKLSKAVTLMSLSKFVLTNINQLSMVPVITDMKSTGKALGQFLNHPKNAWSEAEASGALDATMRESLNQIGGDSLASKMYGIKASEGFNRVIAGIAGKHYVGDLFNKLQKDPTNIKVRRSLEDLTLTNADDLLKQDTLTPKQLNYGATRVSEKSQGRAGTIDLPYNWNRSPYVSLLTLYKKYAFSMGRNIKNAMKNDPTKPFVSAENGVNLNGKNAALMAALFQLTGEVTGDARAAIKGAFNGTSAQQVQNRGDYLPLNSFMNRVVQNYIDSTFLGLMGDVAKSARTGKDGLYSFVLGPVYGGAIDMAGNIATDIGNAKNVIRNPNKSNTLKGLALKVPYVGSSIYEKMRDNAKD